jgi:hypothetical protein
MAGLVPAIHAARALPSVIGTDNYLGSMLWIGPTVFSWMAGSSSAKTPGTGHAYKQTNRHRYKSQEYLAENQKLS